LDIEMKERNEGDLVDNAEVEQEKKETHAMIRGLKFNLFIMSFMAIVREGLECIVFLAGLTSSYSGESMIFPSISGVLIGCLLGYLFIRTSQAFAMLYFVLISMLMLFMIGGGLMTRAFTELIELGLEGGPKVFNAKSCCNQNIPFWGFMRIIFGYNDNPTTVEFCVYFGYWVLVLFLSWYKGLFTLISASLMDYQTVLSDKYIDVTRRTKNKDEKDSYSTTLIEESPPRVSSNL
jgi:FTR1 family protein